MAAEATTKTWLSPLVGLIFAVIGVSGVLMFFHVRLPGMTMLHELAGLLFVIVATVHLSQHLRSFLACCRQRKGRTALVFGTIGCALVLVLGFGHDSRRHRGPPPGTTEPAQR